MLRDTLVDCPVPGFTGKVTKGSRLNEKSTTAGPLLTRESRIPVRVPLKGSCACFFVYGFLYGFNKRGLNDWSSVLGCICRVVAQGL